VTRLNTRALSGRGEDKVEDDNTLKSQAPNPKSQHTPKSQIPTHSQILNPKQAPDFQSPSDWISGI
jgi:hypothetical protein